MARARAPDADLPVRDLGRAVPAAGLERGAPASAPPVLGAPLRAGAGVGRAPRRPRRPGDTDRGDHRHRAARARPAARPCGRARPGRAAASSSRCRRTTVAGRVPRRAACWDPPPRGHPRCVLRGAAAAVRRRERRRVPRPAPRSTPGERAPPGVDPARDAQAQRGLVAAADLVLAGRYHPLVFAVSAHVPVVPIAYQHKATGVAEAAGLGDRVLHAAGLTRPTSSPPSTAPSPRPTRSGRRWPPPSRASTPGRRAPPISPPISPAAGGPEPGRS